MNFCEGNLYVRGEANFGSIYDEAETDAVSHQVAVMNLNGAHTRNQQDSFEQLASARLGGHAVVSVNSGGSALDIVLDFLNLATSDEVVSSAVNFFGVHFAVLRAGARLVLADCGHGDINLCPQSAAAAMTVNTRAVIVTHMNGIVARQAEIRKRVELRAQELGIQPPMIIEDAARAMGANFNSLGATGETIRIYSLHRKKIISTLGQGGLLQTNNVLLTQHALNLRSYGLGVVLGTSLRLTEAQAAVGIRQLEKLSSLVNRRRELVSTRQAAFEQAGLQEFFYTLRGEGDVPYLHTIVLKEAMAEQRDELMRVLATRGIGTVIANRPTNRTHQLVSSSGQYDNLDRSDQVGARLLCLPVHPSMTPSDEANFAAQVERTFAEVAGD